MYAFALRPVGLFLPEIVHVAARFVCDSWPTCSCCSRLHCFLILLDVHVFSIILIL